MVSRVPGRPVRPQMAATFLGRRARRRDSEAPGMSTLARIVTTCQNGRGHSTVDANREHMLRLFDYAAPLKPDLVCFPEAFTGVGIPKPEAGEKVAEPVPGPTTEAFGAKAKELGCYVIAPFRTKRDGLQWNSAVILDRQGEVVGIYDKAQPVTTSPDYTLFENGITPGGQPPVFDLDFGRIGIQICFDAGFPESWQALADQDARIIFWPSAYHGGFTHQAYARFHNIPIVTSVRSQESRIIDAMGRVVAATDQFVNVCAWTLNTDYVVCHNDFNWGVQERILAKYGDRIRLSSYRDDGHFIVEPMDDGLSCAELQSEFGFESEDTYHQRHREAYQVIHEGGTPPAQEAAHGSRGQYSK